MKYVCLCTLCPNYEWIYNNKMRAWYKIYFQEIMTQRSNFIHKKQTGKADYIGIKVQIFGIRTFHKKMYSWKSVSV